MRHTILTLNTHISICSKLELQSGFKLKCNFDICDLRDKKVSLSWCPLSLSLCPCCPWTRAGSKIPGQTPLCRYIPGQNRYMIVKKESEKKRKIVKKFFFQNFSLFSSFFLLSHADKIPSWILNKNSNCLVPPPILDFDRLSCPVARF